MSSPQVERIDAIWPEVIAAVITTNDNQVNLAPINYLAVSTAYEKPITVCVGLGNQSYTLETVLKTCEFVLSYPGREQLAEVLRCGTVSGRAGDKLANSRLTFSPSKIIGAPVLDGAVMSCECKVVHHYNAGTFTIVIAEVVKVHESELHDLDKIYALGGMKYGIISEVKTLQEGR